MNNPTEPAWPTYEIGPNDSIFAIGVASINFARLEYALSLLFSTVTDIPLDLTNGLFPKIGNDTRTALIMRALEKKKKWPNKKKQEI